MPGTEDANGERVALVHDYLLVRRGAERTFEAIAACFPAAPVSTLLYDEVGTGGQFSDRLVRTSYLQRLGARQSNFRRLMPLLPGATERLDVSGADLVVSSSGGFAHGVRPDPGAVHVCYCHSPFRYAWHERERALAEAPRALRPAAALTLAQIRRWDRRVATRPTRYIANSHITQQRIREFWNRDASVVYPPVAVDRFRIGDPEDYFIFIGEVTRHKRVDVALEAARMAGVCLKVVGDGPEMGRLRERYGDRADFLGRVDDDALVDLCAGARAGVVPNVEEFGIAAVEIQAAGRPVVAPRAGGTAETVVDGETGILVDDQSPGTFAEVLRNTDFERFDSQAIRRHAERFSTAAFHESLKREIAAALVHA